MANTLGTNNEYIISQEEFEKLAVTCNYCDSRVLITRLTAHIILNHFEKHLTKL
jgi:hypothetical protein